MVRKIKIRNINPWHGLINYLVFGVSQQWIIRTNDPVQDRIKWYR